MATNRLEKDHKFFLSLKPMLLKDGKEGRFALVEKEKLIDTFSTEKEAYEEGVRRFGQNLFLVQQIRTDETVESILSFSHVVL